MQTFWLLRRVTSQVYQTIFTQCYTHITLKVAHSTRGRHAYDTHDTINVFSQFSLIYTGFPILFIFGWWSYNSTSFLWSVSVDTQSQAMEKMIVNYLWSVSIDIDWQEMNPQMIFQSWLRRPNYPPELLVTSFRLFISLDEMYNGLTPSASLGWRGWMGETFLFGNLGDVWTKGCKLKRELRDRFN